MSHRRAASDYAAPESTYVPMLSELPRPLSMDAISRMSPDVMSEFQGLHQPNQPLPYSPDDPRYKIWYDEQMEKRRLLRDRLRMRDHQAQTMNISPTRPRTTDFLPAEPSALYRDEQAARAAMARREGAVYLEERRRDVRVPPVVSSARYSEPLSAPSTYARYEYDVDPLHAYVVPQRVRYYVQEPEGHRDAALLPQATLAPEHTRPSEWPASSSRRYGIAVPQYSDADGLSAGFPPAPRRSESSVSRLGVPLDSAAIPSPTLAAYPPHSSAQSSRLSLSSPRRSSRLESPPRHRHSYGSSVSPLSPLPPPSKTQVKYSSSSSSSSSSSHHSHSRARSRSHSHPRPVVTRITVQPDPHISDRRHRSYTPSPHSRSADLHSTRSPQMEVDGDVEPRPASRGRSPRSRSPRAQYVHRQSSSSSSSTSSSDVKKRSSTKSPDDDDLLDMDSALPDLPRKSKRRERFSSTHTPSSSSSSSSASSSSSSSSRRTPPRSSSDRPSSHRSTHSRPRSRSRQRSKSSERSKTETPRRNNASSRTQTTPGRNSSAKRKRAHATLDAEEFGGPMGAPAEVDMDLDLQISVRSDGVDEHDKDMIGVAEGTEEDDAVDVVASKPRHKDSLRAPLPEGFANLVITKKLSPQSKRAKHAKAQAQQPSPAQQGNNKSTKAPNGKFNRPAGAADKRR